MLIVDVIRADNKKLQKTNRYRAVESAAPLFSWSARSDRREDRQAACRLTVSREEQLLWDSGWIGQEEQSLRYAGAALPAEVRLQVTVTLRSTAGEESAPVSQWFFLSGLSALTPEWIAPAEDAGDAALCFKREFSLDKPLRHACAYVSGIGLHRFSVNGSPVEDADLEPPTSDYTKSIYFVFYPELENILQPGPNALAVEVGQGWRRNEGQYIAHLTDRKVEFFGRPQLSALLHLIYTDGTEEWINTDERWLAGTGGVTFANLFNGETFDAARHTPGWEKPGMTPAHFAPAVKVASPGGVPRTALLEPVTEQETYAPRTLWPLGEGDWMVDFGQNIAGVLRLTLPGGLAKGQTITLCHSEELEADGTLSGATMRGARSVDTYIAAGDGRDLTVFRPRFLYHGFRYARITGLPLLTKEQVTAVSFYNDIALQSYFSCGSAAANAAQKLIVQTEKANLHHLLTDCPQRDERMGWLNDATVRFEETPYNFDINALFPKVLRDVADTQSEDGAITCTAPYVYGQRPADPVSSSYLVAGLEHFRRNGDKSVLEQYYRGFAAWENCLGDHAAGEIVNFSHYGDWASPVYACVGGEASIDAVQSLYAPGTFMSTGFYYYNATLLAHFARELGKTEDEARWNARAEGIRKALLAKWWDHENARMAGGSQGCQAFALWLGILPEEKRAEAAKIMRDDLVARDYRMTTGNITTRYLYDMLTAYGYVDEAWTLFTRQEYPSYGYMIQNGATTVWERFESKRETGMNSHCHPMYGSAGYWLYAYIAGIRVTTAGASRVTVAPHFPKDLLSAEAAVETVRGTVAVRWMKRWGELSLNVTVPFGVTAEVVFNGQTHTVGSGFWTFTAPWEEPAYV